MGREAELARAQDAFRALERGEGGTLLVTGEAGLGKTRLLAELRRERAAGRMRWIEGRCVSYGESLPYWPFQGVLRDAFGRKGGEPLRDALEAECRRLLGAARRRGCRGARDRAGLGRRRAWRLAAGPGATTPALRLRRTGPCALHRGPSGRGAGRRPLGRPVVALPAGATARDHGRGRAADRVGGPARVPRARSSRSPSWRRRPARIALEALDRSRTSVACWRAWWAKRRCPSGWSAGCWSAPRATPSTSSSSCGRWQMRGRFRAPSPAGRS